MLRTILILILICLPTLFLTVSAQTVESLKSKIDEKNNQIENLEKEITQFQKEIDTTGKQAQTLQNTIKTLDITRSKLNANIQVTENKIDSTNLTIERLALEIENKKEGIGENINAVKASLREIKRYDDTSLIETLLNYKSITDFWEEQARIEQFERGVQEKVATLKELKSDLENKKSETEIQKNKLVELKLDLADQKTIVDVNKKEKSNLLTQTKNTEANFKKLLKEKEALRAAFEKELRSFESELRIAIDPKSIPPAGKGILSWPLDSILVTQHFGNTSFSKTVLAYNGQGHNGVDFRASPGTKIKSALSGTIAGTGNTDTTCPGASYGKWVLVNHSNGLSTLYAHLSLIKVSKGAEVATGDILGYSGNTGYSTGPHLHFSVFASQGVKIIERQSRVCGSTYTMPVADLKAYLDPLIYL